MQIVCNVRRGGVDWGEGQVRPSNSVILTFPPFFIDGPSWLLVTFAHPRFCPIFPLILVLIINLTFNFFVGRTFLDISP